MRCAMNEPVIELKNIFKSFNDYSVLTGVDLCLFPSETISIIGASGTGKTTLVNILSLLEYPDQGKIYWGGIPMVNKSAKDISQLRGARFGFVFQNHNLISELNILENVLFPIKMHSVIQNKDVLYAEKLLNRVGLLPRKNDRINHLSGGQKQRISVIRALINRPQIILADEPTGNLDEKNAREAINLMLELCKFTNSSMILITHNDELAKLTDKKFVLFDGQLIQQQDA